MSVILDTHKLFYAAVPKTACTSIKAAFFELENGYPFKPFVVNGQRKSLHGGVYKSPLRENFPDQRIADYMRLAVVRDPVKRFLSAYGNRVLHYKELHQPRATKELARFGLTPDPDLNLFVDRLEDYTAVHPSILHHIRPTVDYLGTDPAYFTRLYPIQDLDQFAADVTDRTGTPLVIGRKQTGGPKIDPDALDAARLARVRDYYAADYDTFGSFF